MSVARSVLLKGVLIALYSLRMYAEITRGVAAARTFHQQMMEDHR